MQEQHRLDDITAGPGTYLLVLAASQPQAVQVGRLGQIELQPGYYLYIGSAFGSGGIRSRVKHHARIAARPHWHLDYIRPFLSLQSIWYSHDTVPRECAWAASLAGKSTISEPLPGFGASDCVCATHLFYQACQPRFADFKKLLVHHALNRMVL